MGWRVCPPASAAYACWAVHVFADSQTDGPDDVAGTAGSMVRKRLQGSERRMHVMPRSPVCPVSSTRQATLDVSRHVHSVHNRSTKHSVSILYMHCSPSLEHVTIIDVVATDQLPQSSTSSTDFAACEAKTAASTILLARSTPPKG